MEAQGTVSRRNKVIIRIVIALLVLFIGVFGMRLLAKFKKPPAEVAVKEPKLKVEAKKVMPENVNVNITSYGEVKAIDVVKISPQVTGKIIAIHPQLEVGETVKKGELLFKIDPNDYTIALNEAKASVAQSENSLKRLQTELEISQKRFKSSLRNRDLAKSEFERVKRLFRVNRIGTRSGVDSAERAYLSAVDQVNLLTQSVKTYPLRIKEAEYLLQSAKSRELRARTNLDRCSVFAAFEGRIKQVSVEVEQYVAPGQPVLTLVNDKKLEIHVPIDSSDARQWLKFKMGAQKSGYWFNSLSPASVDVRWTDDSKGQIWKGKLDRVVNYNKQTRTLTLAVQLDSNLSISNGTLPLVEGMFCSVIIPGKSMRRVFRLPRWAVSLRNRVYIVSENRLKTVPVKVGRIQNDEVFVKSGLKEGDNVIVTRLIEPLENSLIEITKQK